MTNSVMAISKMVTPHVQITVNAFGFLNLDMHICLSSSTNWPSLAVLVIKQETDLTTYDIEELIDHALQSGNKYIYDGNHKLVTVRFFDASNPDG